MNGIFVLILSLSVSASIIALLLFALRPLYRDRLSKTWQYYIWLVVLVRLLVPVTLEYNLVGWLFQPREAVVSPQPDAAVTADRQAAVRETAARSDAAEAAPAAGGPAYPTAPAGPTNAQNTGSSGFSVSLANAAQYLWVVWGVTALVLLVRKITSYHSFVRFIKAGRQQETDEGVLELYRQACLDAGVSNPLPVYRNKLAVSPMLVGILRPFIVLPELDVDEEELRLVLRHELAHHSRRDILYKWLLQVATCLHWFNPVIHLVGREINHNCELSCDEMVIRRLSAEHHRRYGDTLLATLKTGGSYGDTVASVTLSEDGKQLKERLGAILKFRPSSPKSKAVAAALTLVIIFSAAFVGGYAGISTARGATFDGNVPIILPQDQYTLLLEAGVKDNTAIFQVNNARTVLYVDQQGEGDFSFTLKNAQTGKTVASSSAMTFQQEDDPILEFAMGRGLYELELSPGENAPGYLAVYGAGIEKSGSTRSLSLPGLVAVPVEKTLDLVGDVVADVLDGTLDTILDPDNWSRLEDSLLEMEEKIVNKSEEWADRWEQKAGDWEKKAEDWAERWEQYADRFPSGNGESWYYLNYRYRDDYLVGVGWRRDETPGSYSRSTTMEFDGASYTVYFAPDAAGYADDAQVLAVVRQIISEDLLNGSRRRSTYSPSDWNKGLFVVRSVHYAPDPDPLLRTAYEEDMFAEFWELVRHCSQPAIEGLLSPAFDNQDELYFMALAEQLDNLPNAEALARRAAERGDIIILSALERFLDSSLSEELMLEALGIELPELSTMFS